jgi:hypothetical protein
VIGGLQPHALATEAPDVRPAMVAGKSPLMFYPRRFHIDDLPLEPVADITELIEVGQAKQ